MQEPREKKTNLDHIRIKLVKLRLISRQWETKHDHLNVVVPTIACFYFSTFKRTATEHKKKKPKRT